MLLARPMARLVLGVLLLIVGAIWTLQGLDVFGQDGGMNGQTEWSVIGAVTLLIGVALAVSGYRARTPV